MHRIDDPTAVPTLPAPRAQGTPGYFTGGSPGSSGFAATIVRYEWLNSHQEELAHVVETAGLTLNKTDNTQLLQALNKLFVSRTLATANMTIYVNPTTGNDSNNGLTAGTAFATIAQAINAIYRWYDWNGFGCTIQLADGTYTYNVANGWLAVFAGMPFGMQAFGLSVQGNPSSPQNVVLSATLANCILVDRALIYLSGVTIRATGTVWTLTGIQGLGLNCTRGGWAQCSNIRFDATGGMFPVRCDWQGMAAFSGANIGITGSGQWGMAATFGGQIFNQGATINVAGWSAVNPLWWVDQGRMELSGTVFAGTATGQRYGVWYNGVINTNGGGPNFFPGTVAGTVTSGGQYA